MGWTVILENEQKEVIEELDREFYFDVNTGSMEFKLLKITLANLIHEALMGDWKRLR